MKDKISRIRIPLLIGLLGLQVAQSSAVAAETDETASFIGPELVSNQGPIYPSSQGHQRNSGMVELGFMVDTSGLTFEPMVLRSTHPRFERASLKAAKKHKYTPATFVGKKVESLVTRVDFYWVPRSEDAVPPKFARMYKSSMKLLDAKSPDNERILRKLHLMETSYLRGALHLLIFKEVWMP